MRLYRKYAANEVPEVGDIIVQLGTESKPSTEPFSTCIVQAVCPPDKWNTTWVHLERVHARADGGQVGILVERFPVSLDGIRHGFLVYLSGHSGNKDNRSY